MLKDNLYKELITDSNNLMTKSTLIFLVFSVIFLILILIFGNSIDFKVLPDVYTGVFL